MILSIDLDGTLISEETSEFLDFDMELIEAFIDAQKAGHYLILNTCREGEELEERIQAITHLGLVFNSINKNRIQMYKGRPTSKKIDADVYYDNKSFNWDRAAALQHVLSITRDPKWPAKFLSVPVYNQPKKGEPDESRNTWNSP